MPFSIETFFEAGTDSFFADLANETVGGISYSPEDVSNAVRLAIRDTMRQYTKRVDTLTFYWKPENKPTFISNFRPEQQLGLHALESGPVIFVLDNTDIWGLVSAGSPAHQIKPKPGNSLLRFTGWDAETGVTGIDIGRSFRSRAAAARRGSLGRARGARLGDVSRVRSYDEAEGSFPPTYIPSTRPNVYSSGAPPQALGNATIRLTHNSREFDRRPVVNHPGFEGRNLTGILLGTHGNAPGGDLIDFYSNQVYVRLDQTVPDSELGRTSPNIRAVTGRREFTIDPEGRNAGRQSFAVSRFLNP